ncbi:hypothetical protein AVEN_190206-1 [Araneus ventricosus]|uniref:Uncharacterized protein n=1 Tax=Araneus ventricosus TaxID=182803 RepID=A0A4Y2R6A7_ARAVE|nr:hypothetical protein AVEN_190206-1 [Araneus ventricosus]
MALVGDRGGVPRSTLPIHRWGMLYQKVTNSVAVVWRSAVLLKDGPSGNCGTAIATCQCRCLTSQSAPHGAWCCVITCAHTVHYRHSLGYCPMWR